MRVFIGNLSLEPIDGMRIRHRKPRCIAERCLKAYASSTADEMRVGAAAVPSKNPDPAIILTQRDCGL